MNKITTSTERRPVRFDDRIVALTPGQKNIIDLITYHLKRKSDIQNDDILECYIKSVSDNGKQRKVGLQEKNGKKQYGEYTITLTKYSQGINQKARQWYKANLGKCVIKGRLLVIPVINFED